MIFFTLVYFLPINMNEENDSEIFHVEIRNLSQSTQEPQQNK